tara:strand:+ start:565 stop:1137 length:573 start_codon:yes stop_codon:yes gene_type:complete
MTETRKLVVPEGYQDVSVRQYKNMLELFDKKLPEKELSLLVVSALCDISRKDLDNADWRDVSKLMDMVAWITKEPETSSDKNPLIREFTLKGIDYGFIPNWTKLTLGEFADLETYTGLGAYEKLESILSVLYRPILKRSVDSYSIEPYNPNHEKQQAMLDCKMNIAVSAMVFFYRIGTILAKDSQRYSKP